MRSTGVAPTDRITAASSLGPPPRSATRTTQSATLWRGARPARMPWDPRESALARGSVTAVAALLGRCKRSGFRVSIRTCGMGCPSQRGRNHCCPRALGSTGMTRSDDCFGIKVTKTLTDLLEDGPADSWRCIQELLETLVCHRKEAAVR